MTTAALNPSRFLLDVEQLLSGGIAIRTPMEVAEGGRMMVETVIQPNGDILTKIDPACLSGNDVWRDHCQQVQLVLNRYRNFMCGIRALTHWGVLVCFLAGAAAATIKAWVISALLSLIPVIVSLSLRYALSRWLKRLLA